MDKKISEYSVLESYDPTRLERDVCAQLGNDENWQPYGDLQVIKIANSDGDVFYKYIQSMVK